MGEKACVMLLDDLTFQVKYVRGNEKWGVKEIKPIKIERWI